MGSIITIIFESWYRRESIGKMKRINSGSTGQNEAGCKLPKTGEETGKICMTSQEDVDMDTALALKSDHIDCDSESEANVSNSHIGEMCIDLPYERTNGDFLKPNSQNGRYESDDIETNAELQLNELPTSVLLHILKFLPIKELVQKATLVCKRWNDLCMDPDLWRDVSFKGYLKVGDDVLERYTSFQRKATQSLDITDLRLITTDGLRRSLAHCDNLKKLYIVR